LNVLADRLFALLLGWTRALFNSLWNLVTDPTAGISDFIRRFWLPMILVILVFGTAMDFIVWLIRWRPYLIWRDWFRRRDARRRLTLTRHYMEDLDHSPLDLPEYREGAAYGSYAQDEPVYFDFGQQAAPPAEYLTPGGYPSGGYPQAPPQAPLYTPVLPWEQYRPAEPASDGQVAYGASEWQENNQAAVPERMGQDTAWMEAEYAESPAPLTDPAYPERRRRAGSRRGRQSGLLRSLKETLFDQEDALAPLDALPPPIPQEEAYHKPYYPQNYNYKPTAQDREPPLDLPPG